MRLVRRVLWLSACLAASACSATEGRLFATSAEAGLADAPEATPLDAGHDGAEAGGAAATLTVRQGMRLQYQLVGTIDPNADADVFVIDLFETPRVQIEGLQARGKVVVAYIAAGSVEPWRPDVDALPAAVIGNPLTGYPDESWLDVRAASVRQLLVGRLTLAADKGFDGVLLVSLDGYLANSGHGLSVDDQLDYDLWLAARARQAGLAAGISSAWPLAGTLAAHYDFAIHLNCLTNQRCDELAPYRAKGRAVFDLETGSTDTQRVCSDASALKLPVTLKRETFDAWLFACH